MGYGKSQTPLLETLLSLTQFTISSFEKCFRYQSNFCIIFQPILLDAFGVLYRNFKNSKFNTQRLQILIRSVITDSHSLLTCQILDYGSSQMKSLHLRLIVYRFPGSRSVKTVRFLEFYKQFDTTLKYIISSNPQSMSSKLLNPCTVSVVFIRIHENL